MKKHFATFLTIILFLGTVSAQDFYKHPVWASNAVIYEVNVRQFTREGTFKAFEKQLPRLKAMGVDILWLMPIYPIGEKERKGTLGSYYAVKDYRGVNAEFGNTKDLKDLVNKAHGMGMKVILDWVANHSSMDNPLIDQHPDWFTHDSTGKISHPVPDWADVADFNYDNKELWNYQIESLKYWIREADVDGFRCDVAMMVPVEFWKKARTELDQVKPVFMLAEAEGPEFHRNGFDMSYGWEMHHIMNEIAKGKMHADELPAYFKKSDTLYRKSDIRMYFTSNHDENSWNGTEYERMGKAVEAMAAFSYVLPGMPLIYTGQESAEKRRLSFFDKDSVAWGNYPLAGFYTKLNKMKHLNPALLTGTNPGAMKMVPCGNKEVFGIERTKGNNQVMGLFNFSDSVQEIKLPAGLNGSYLNPLTGATATLKAGSNLKLGPWEYTIWVKKP